ncbi:unnamed protein product [Urochloa humidicola]
MESARAELLGCDSSGDVAAGETRLTSGLCLRLLSPPYILQALLPKQEGEEDGSAADQSGREGERGDGRSGRGGWCHGSPPRGGRTGSGGGRGSIHISKQW